MKSLVLALFLSSTEAIHQHQHMHQHLHHHHQPHHHGHQALAQFSHKPNFDQFLALDTAERSHQKIQMQNQQKMRADQQERGIIEKV